MLKLLVVFFLLVAGAVHAAEPKTMDQLLAERAGVNAAIETMSKQFAANQAEFDKTPAAIAHFDKQNALRKAYGDAEVRQREINAAIADLVAKGKK